MHSTTHAILISCTSAQLIYAMAHNSDEINEWCHIIARSTCKSNLSNRVETLHWVNKYRV